MAKEEKRKILPVLEERKLHDAFFNTAKMRETLMDADALMRLMIAPFALYFVVVVMLLAWDPLRFPVSEAFVFSMILWGGYYAALGAMRRWADSRLNELKVIEDFDYVPQKPLRREDDTKFTRTLFKIMDRSGQPARGSGQFAVAIGQWVIFVAYVVNFWIYVGEQLPVPETLWKIHAAATTFGLFMMLKNGWFLLKARPLIALLRTLDWQGTAGRIADQLVGTKEEVVIHETMAKCRFAEGKPPVQKCGKCIGELSRKLAEEFTVIPDSSAPKQENPKT